MTTDVFRAVDAQGRVIYGDAPPPGARSYTVIHGNGKREEVSPDNNQDQVRSAIKEAQRRIPKLNDYLEYLDYLRHRNPMRFERVLTELQREDPQTWLKLQQYPQFRSLKQTALGPRSASKHIEAGIGLATGKWNGSVEKWLETTVKDMMKRDRFGPYAPVLGSKASTLPTPPAPSYSNSRLGQRLKIDDAAAARNASAAAKELEASRAAVRASRATAITRAGGPLLDLGIGALDPNTFSGISAIEGLRLKRTLVAKGILTPEEGDDLPGMMARGEFDRVRAMIEAGAERAAQAR